jgi:hypothetical protein
VPVRVFIDFVAYWMPLSGCAVLGWIDDRIKLIEGTGLKSASRGNYFRSVVKFIEFVRDSPAVAFNAPGCQLSTEQDHRLSRSIDAWLKRTKITSKLAKREAIQFNNQENYQSKQQWASISEIRGAANRVVAVLKKRMTQSDELTESDRKEYVNFLFTVMLCYRPGRPGSTAGLYAHRVCSCVVLFDVDRLLSGLHSDLGQFTSANVTKDKEIVFQSTRHKTVDHKHDDVHVYSDEMRQLIQFYVDRIRPVFAARYKASDHKSKIQKLEPEKSLLLTHQGLRFEKFNAFPAVLERLIGKHINATVWRKIISTESVERLSAEEAEIVFRNNAHDAKTAARHYQLLQKQNIAIRGANILNRMEDSTYSSNSQRTPTAAAVTQPSSFSSSASSSFSPLTPNTIAVTTPQSSSLSLFSSSSSTVSSTAATTVLASPATTVFDTTNDDAILRGLFAVKRTKAMGPPKKKTAKSGPSRTMSINSDSDSESASSSKKKKARRSTKPTPPPPRSTQPPQLPDSDEPDDETSDSAESSAEESAPDSDSDEDAEHRSTASSASSSSSSTPSSVPRSAMRPVTVTAAAVPSSNQSSTTVDDGDDDEDTPLAIRLGVASHSSVVSSSTSLPGATRPLISVNLPASTVQRKDSVCVDAENIPLSISTASRSSTATTADQSPAVMPLSNTAAMSMKDGDENTDPIDLFTTSLPAPLKRKRRRIVDHEDEVHPPSGIGAADLPAGMCMQRMSIMSIL